MTNLERVQRIVMAAVMLPVRERNAVMQRVAQVLGLESVGAESPWSWDAWADWLGQRTLDTANSLDRANARVLDAVENAPLHTANELDKVYQAVADRAAVVRDGIKAQASEAVWLFAAPVALVLALWAMRGRR